MSSAARKSPFADLKEDEDWLLWRRKSPIFPHLQEKQTDGRYACTEEANPESDHSEEFNMVPTVPPLQRNQYNALQNRFDIASKRAGSFSAWNT